VRRSQEVLQRPDFLCLFPGKKRNLLAVGVQADAVAAAQIPGVDIDVKLSGLTIADRNEPELSPVSVGSGRCRSNRSFGRLMRNFMP
jgi:hypothetical protein